MFSRPARQRHSAIFFAVTAALELAVPARPHAQNLVANPVLARDLPPPGWIGDHRDTWIKQHAVYASTCETNEVTKEIRFLNRTLAYDEYLLSLTNQPDTGNPAAGGLAQVARASMGTLRHDVVVIDALVAQLQLLPPCEGSPAPPATKAVAIGPEAIPPAQKASAQSTAPAQPRPAPEPVAVSAKAVEPAPAKPVAVVAATPSAPVAAPVTPPPVAPAPETTQTAAATAPPLADSDRLVIRFDDKVAALTPSGIRAFSQAITAAKSGKPVQLAIEGCDANADFSSGTPCARRLYSLENRLKDAGIKDPRRLFADLP